MAKRRTSNRNADTSGRPAAATASGRQVVIENPILNSPFAEPTRHFRFTDEGITDQIVEARRISSYFIPKCHISHVVAGTDSWEQKMVQTLEGMPEVLRHVKNHNLGLTIPYAINGGQKQYIPGFIADLHDGHGPADRLNLIVEVTREPKKDKAAKVSTARTLWVPAVNNHGGFGRWAFLEIPDPWDAQHRIRASLSGEST